MFLFVSLKAGNKSNWLFKLAIGLIFLSSWEMKSFNLSNLSPRIQKSRSNFHYILT